VGTLAVVADLDPREDRRPCRRARRLGPRVDELGHGVVEARARPAHRADHTVGDKHSLVARRRVPGPAIGVLDEPRAEANAAGMVTAGHPDDAYGTLLAEAGLITLVDYAYTGELRDAPTGLV